MRTFLDSIRFGLAGLFVLQATVTVAWSQATSPVPASENAGNYGLFAFVFVFALIAVIGAIVKLYDMKRKRDDQAVALQSRLSDALLTEPWIAHLPVTPTVHVPFGRHGQAIVELSGKVPSADLHEVVLQVVKREAASMAHDYRIEDGLFVDRQMSRRVA